MHPAVMTLNGWIRKTPVWPFYLIGFIPVGWYVFAAATDQLGPDPVKALEHGLGKIGLQFLIASLCVTPLLRLTRINLMCFRRMLGLMAFYYVALHFAVYLLLDLQLDWSVLAKDLTKRPYIIVGTLALLMLIPLALTSTNWAVRKLGSAAWCRLHMLAYPAVALGAVHYIWLVKSWPFEPLAYCAVVAVLLGYRIARNLRSRARASATA
ncbi:MAG: protein-methionine-sulfoxide reductase heme-binding subunit MsrQ [Pseudomonadota bacterium]